MDFKKTLWEAAKEPLRILLLAIIPVLLTYFEVIDANWAIGITVFLRFLDKYLHLLGKSADIDGKGSILTKGITRF